MEASDLGNEATKATKKGIRRDGTVAKPIVSHGLHGLHGSAGALPRDGWSS
jgi:hypothetical protein